MISQLNESQWGWVVQLLLLAGAVVLVRLLLDVILRKLEKLAFNTRTIWDDALLSSAHKPVGVLVWLIALNFAADIAHPHLYEGLYQLVAPVIRVGCIVVGVWFVIASIRQAEANYLQQKADEERSLDQTTLTALGNLGRVAIIVVGILIALQSLGFSISGVLAFGGIGGIAIGFAAKDLLANLFGSLVIFLDRPFKIGDWIRSPDREIEGAVEHIGWRITVIRTFDKRPLYVPNSVFSTISIENPSRMSNRRIYETIGIRYADFHAMEAITREIHQMLIEHPEIDNGQPLMVNFTKYGASSLDFFIYTFTKTIVWDQFHAVKQDVLLRIGEIIARHGAEIAFPTTTVHLLPESAKGEAT